MGIPTADIWAALSSAPTDKPVRTARPVDVSRTERQHKGFSAVLKKVRDVDARDEVRKTDDMPSPSKTEERSNVKEARNVENDVRTRGNDGKSRTAAGSETERAASSSQSAKQDDRPGVSKANENGQTRPEQAETSSARIANSNEANSSKDSSGEESVTGTNGSLTGAEAQLNANTQGQVPLFLSTLVASTTNQQPADQRPYAEDNTPQSVDDELQPEEKPSTSNSVVHDASMSLPVVSKNGETSASGSNRDGAVQTQQQPTLGRSVPQAEQDVPVAGASDSRQASNSHEMGVAEKVVGQDTSTRPVILDAGSPNMKATTLELKNIQPTMELIQKDQVTVKPKQDADPKMTGQLLDHPLLSPSQAPSPAAQARDNNALNGMPLSQQGLKSILGATEDFREMWAGLRDGKQDQGEGKPLPMAFSEQQSLVGQRTESFAIGAQAMPASGSGSVPQGGTALSHSQSTQATHMTAPAPFPLVTKSVVFDVIQPDLGHVNIRVAMTNDVVHAHLSTDRQEVGQSLISGQERLQSSLQANGLDMGQFRVDIDRQSAGRSFQQGFSQEQQERGWNQQGSWVEGTSTSHTYEDPRAPRQGLLNVMA